MVSSRLTAKGQIISHVSEFQYLTGLRRLHEGTYRLYRFTKINMNMFQKIPKPLKMQQIHLNIDNQFYVEYVAFFMQLL